MGQPPLPPSLERDTLIRKEGKYYKLGRRLPELTTQPQAPPHEVVLLSRVHPTKNPTSPRPLQSVFQLTMNHTEPLHWFVRPPKPTPHALIHLHHFVPKPRCRMRFFTQSLHLCLCLSRHLCNSLAPPFLRDYTALIHHTHTYSWYFLHNTNFKQN